MGGIIGVVDVDPVWPLIGVGDPLGPPGGDGVGIAVATVNGTVGLGVE